MLFRSPPCGCQASPAAEQEEQQQQQQETLCSRERSDQAQHLQQHNPADVHCETSPRPPCGCQASPAAEQEEQQQQQQQQQQWQETLCSYEQSDQAQHLQQHNPADVHHEMSPRPPCGCQASPAAEQQQGQQQHLPALGTEVHNYPPLKKRCTLGSDSSTVGGSSSFAGDSWSAEGGRSTVGGSNSSPVGSSGRKRKGPRHSHHLPHKRAKMDQTIFLQVRCFCETGRKG